MKGDFSTPTTFDPEKDFFRVLTQYGSVQTDGDWNEQAANLLHYMQTLAVDLIGPYAGPVGAYGFAVTPNGENDNFDVGKGRYYVGGLLCENTVDDVTYLNQPYLPDPEPLQAKSYVIYLDVWERHLNHLEGISAREKALNRAGIATRSNVVWQVKAQALDSPLAGKEAVMPALKNRLALSDVGLRVRINPDLIGHAGYPKNRLYRVEIHCGGDRPTFKWSRESDAVVFPAIGVEPDAAGRFITVQLGHLGYDHTPGLMVDDWVEFVDDESVLKNNPDRLYQVASVDIAGQKVRLKGDAAVVFERHNIRFLRRWDQQGATLELGVLIKWNEWMALENGLEICFESDNKPSIRSGDYWLIPVHNAYGEPDWPKEMDRTGLVVIDNDTGRAMPALVPPDGIVHYYAPLSIVNMTAAGINRLSDCRSSFSPKSSNYRYSYGRLGIGVDLIYPDIKASDIETAV